LEGGFIKVLFAMLENET